MYRTFLVGDIGGKGFMFYGISHCRLQSRYFSQFNSGEKEKREDVTVGLAHACSDTWPGRILYYESFLCGMM